MLGLYMTQCCVSVWPSDGSHTDPVLGELPRKMMTGRLREPRCPRCIGSVSQLYTASVTPTTTTASGRLLMDHGSIRDHHTDSVPRGPPRQRLDDSWWTTAASETTIQTASLMDHHDSVWTTSDGRWDDSSLHVDSRSAVLPPVDFRRPSATYKWPWRRWHITDVYPSASLRLLADVSVLKTFRSSWSVPVGV